MLVLGVGTGLFYSSVTTAGVTALDPSRSGLAGGIVYMFQVAGGSIGLGLTTAIFTTASQDTLQKAALGLSERQTEAADGLLAGTETAAKVGREFSAEAAERLEELVREAFVDGMHWGFRFAAAHGADQRGGVGSAGGRAVDSAILPLAITMMAGPQILSAIVFVTSDRAIAISLAYVAAVGLTTAAWVFDLDADRLGGWATRSRCTSRRSRRRRARCIPLVLVGLLIAGLGEGLPRPARPPSRRSGWPGSRRRGWGRPSSLGVAADHA